MSTNLVGYVSWLLVQTFEENMVLLYMMLWKKWVTRHMVKFILWHLAEPKVWCVCTSPLKRSDLAHLFWTDLFREVLFCSIISFSSSLSCSMLRFKEGFHKVNFGKRSIITSWLGNFIFQNFRSTAWVHLKPHSKSYGT